MSSINSMYFHLLAYLAIFAICAAMAQRITLWTILHRRNIVFALANTFTKMSNSCRKPWNPQPNEPVDAHLVAGIWLPAKVIGPVEHTGWTRVLVDYGSDHGYSLGEANWSQDELRPARLPRPAALLNAG
jgi:hypothetical protein